MSGSAWRWEKVDPAKSGSSGDLSKLFRNEGLKEPGVLGIDAPAPDSTVLAREAIQNSWDAARELRKSLDDEGREAPVFRIVFRYRNLEGSDRERAVETLGLRELADRAASADRQKLGLADDDCLQGLDEQSPLAVLAVEESGTTGMGGPWRGASSKLYLALVSLGFTQKAEGSGGSYGYGKAGLIRGSKIRTVVGYTCFEERPDDPGITRRLLGMTYWGTHKIDEHDYTGFARLGADDPDQPGATAPLVNEAADSLAEAMGIPPRRPEHLDELGSTFLLIDPTVEPGDLVKAIERNWWPALEENDFEVEVVDAAGTSHFPRPRRDPHLRTFIDAFELATTPQDNEQDEKVRRSLGHYQPQGGERYALGHLGLVAELNGWSYAQGSDEADGQVDHQSLVALVRSPHMVVEYYSVGRQQPYVRGVFVADDEVDLRLRDTEPKAHDAWLDHINEEGIHRDAPKIARELLKRLRQEVRRFRRRLKPPPPREQDIHLPLLDQLMRDLINSDGKAAPPPPPGEPRLIGIRVDQHVEAVGDAIRLQAKARFQLTDEYEGERASVRLKVRYAFDEDGRLGDDCPLALVLPEGLAIDSSHPGKGELVVGELGREPAMVAITSDPYDPDWSGQLILTAEVAGSSASKAKGAEG